MSVKSTINNLVHDVDDNLSSAITTAKSSIQNIVGTVKTSLSNVWSGGFTGMDEKGLAELKTQIKNYCNDIQSIINEFDVDGNIEVALKGLIQEGAQDFIKAIKDILNAYVSTIKEELDVVDEAYSNFSKSALQIKTDVVADAEQIRSDANKIKID